MVDVSKDAMRFWVCLIALTGLVVTTVVCVIIEVLTDSEKVNPLTLSLATALIAIASNSSNWSFRSNGNGGKETVAKPTRSAA